MRNEKLSEIELAEIEDRSNAATPGPWYNGKYSVNDSNGIPICCQFTNDNDKALMAHAREDVDKLLAEVRRLTTRCREANSALKIANNLVAEYGHENTALEKENERLYEFYIATLKSIGVLPPQ